MKFILGKKVEMSQIFDEKGNVIPVTLIKAGPCKVSQVKNGEKDGYKAIQIGYDKRKKMTSALKGHLKDLGEFAHIREFRTEEIGDLKRGDNITVGTFEIGEKVKVTGTSKGKGFQGVVKRHGFHGSPASHGHKDQLRMPGSIGATEPARVFKGKKMGGHMGNERISVKNLEIIKIDLENNILYVKGAIPGRRGSMVMVSADGELKVNLENIKKSLGEDASSEYNEEEKQEDIKEIDEKNQPEADKETPEVPTEDKNQSEADKEEKAEGGEPVESKETKEGTK